MERGAAGKLLAQSQPAGVTLRALVLVSEPWGVRMPHGSISARSSELELALLRAMAGRLHGLFHAALPLRGGSGCAK